MSEASRARFAAAVRAPRVDLGLALLLVAAEFDADLDAPGAVDRWRGALDGLAAQVPPDGAAEHRLRAVLGGFACAPVDYADLRSSLLHEVLRRRRGLPILLSAVWLEVGRRVGIPLHGVGLPGHFVVAVEQPGGGHRLLDPARGGAPWRLRPGDAGYDRPWTPVQVLGRVLANVRAWADRPERLGAGLAAVELALLLPHHPATLRHEHGRLRVRAGDFLGGAAELDAYADVLARVDSGAAERVRREARGARARLN